MESEPPTRKKVLISLHSDALEALATLATPRKRGDLISGLILDAHRRRDQNANQIAAQVAAELRRLFEQPNSS